MYICTNTRAGDTRTCITARGRAGVGLSVYRICITIICLLEEYRDVYEHAIQTQEGRGVGCAGGGGRMAPLVVLMSS